MALSSVEPPSLPSASSSGLVWKLALRFGGGAGLLCGLWMVGLQLTGSNGFGPKQILAQLLVPLAAVAAEWTLRARLRPDKPGLARSLGIGLLTALLAATVSAVSLLGVAYGAGESALARNRAEILEILRVQQRENPAVQLTAKQQKQQEEAIAGISASDMAIRNFMQVFLLGLVLAVPAGIFLRE